jgi:hypothetical protein
MCLFEDNVPMYFGGSDDAPVAYVEVNVFGTSVPKSAWEKLTPQIMDALQDTLNVPADRTYIRYTALAAALLAVSPPLIAGTAAISDIRSERIVE